MKKLFRQIVLLGLVLVAFGCNDTEIDRLQALQGKWMCIGESGGVFPSDSVVAVIFNTDMSCTISRGVSTSSGGTRWDVDIDYVYSLSGERVTIRSSSDANVSEEYVMDIGSISGSSMLCTLVSYSLEGVTESYNLVYSFESCNTPLLASVMTGLWGAVTPGNSDELAIWGFSDGGFFEYYLYDTSSGEYLVSMGSGASQLMYGMYVILSFPEYENNAEYYEVWDVESASDSAVVWNRRLSDGSVVSETLSPMEALP